MGPWGKNELQPFGMSPKAHSSEPTAAQVSPANNAGWNEQSQQEQPEMFKRASMYAESFPTVCFASKNRERLSHYSLWNLYMKKMQNSQSTSLLPPPISVHVVN